MITTKTMEIKLKLTLLFTPLFISGCIEPDCIGLRNIVSDKTSNSELRKWSDLHFFENEIPIEKIGHIGFIGPGREKVDPRWVNKTPVTWFHEVRLVGEDFVNPDAIFLARGSYRGLLISRNDDIESVLKSEGIQENEVIAKDLRIAAICRPRG